MIRTSRWFFLSQCRPASTLFHRFGAAIMLVGSLLLGLPGTLSAQDIPVVSVTPTSGPAGTGLQVSGSGFVGDCSVQVVLASSADVEVDLGFAFVESGAFDTSDPAIPTDATAGDYRVIARGLNFGSDDVCSTPSANEASTSFVVTSGELIPRYIPDPPEYDPAEGLPDWVSPNEAHLKFRQGVAVRLTDNSSLPFVFDAAYSPTQQELDELGAINQLLVLDDVMVNRLFIARSVEEYDQARARQERRSGREMADKNLYYHLMYAGSIDAATLLNMLNGFGIVEIAYADPLPGEDPDNHSDDYRDFQGYRTAAPGGINADATYHVSGGRGTNAQVIDIERFFNPDHEDLPTVNVLPNGDVDATWPGDAFDHGTAVLGELFGQDNDFGVLGIVDQSPAGFVSTAGGRPAAIDLAAANSNPGDVILLELQRAGPLGTCSNATTPSQIGCVPEEWVQASYDAVVAAVADDIIIVAAAGNGRQDLDDEDYEDWLDRGDSGAIIVGAGAGDVDSGVSNTGCSADPARSRLAFSNFGSRVNVHGWGNCVATTAYGGLAGGSGDDDAYTGGFSGTSSASPIVAGAAAVVSSVHQDLGLGAPTSTEVRSLLIATGTPQVLPADDPAARAGQIGPLPNLAAALGLSADIEVTKSGSPDPADAGTNVTWTVSVTNNGPDVAVHVGLEDLLPAEVTYVSDTQGCEHTAGVVTCDVGTLLVSETFNVDITASIPPDLVFNAGAPVTITNSASASSSLDDPDETNNAASDDVLVVASGDLRIVSATVLAGVPDEAQVGIDIPVTVRSVVQNLGPSSPMDAELDNTATPSAGASANPASRLTPVDALTFSQRTVDQAFDIRCDEPGEQEVVFDLEIAPANAADSDPDLSNNTAQASVAVTCILPIAINIRPGNAFNRINFNSNQAIPVAALTTGAGEYGLPLAFDAASILPDTVVFGPATELMVSGASPLNGLFHLNDSFEPDDQTRDGDADMRFLFKQSETGIESGDTEACMRGQFTSGGDTFSFFGCDTVATKP